MPYTGTDPIGDVNIGWKIVRCLEQKSHKGASICLRNQSRSFSCPECAEEIEKDGSLLANDYNLQRTLLEKYRDQTVRLERKVEREGLQPNDDCPRGTCAIISEIKAIEEMRICILGECFTVPATDAIVREVSHLETLLGA